MPTQQDIRQSVLRSALNMAGSAANATVDGILIANDPLISKLFEDRNILLTDGGTITFTGTQVQFTENLNITVSQKISGAVPQVISLGSSSQTFTNSGDMLVAVLNRSAGTASVSIVAAGSSLSAVANANQEVFLIAKRVDAGDGTQRLYWRNGFAQNAGQTLRLGQGGGSGSGVGGGSDLNSLTFRAQFIESFTEAATNSASAINGTTGFTNAAYSAAKQMYTINYDASKTATTTSTAVTMSGAPAYTVVAGDVLVNLATNEVKKITVVTSQTSYTIESAFAANLAAGAVCVSQAVHTKDIYNYAGTGAALSAAFPGTTFAEIMVDYQDNATSGSNLWTPDVAPFAAFVGSSDNTNWMTLQTRATNETDTMQSDSCPTAGSSLYLRFFSAKTSGSGFVNLLNYEAFMQKSLANTIGGIVWSSYAITNSSTTPVNCTLSIVGGKTTVTFIGSNQYAVGQNAGQSYGVLDVYLNGQMLPRFVSGSVPPTDGYYTELSQNAIQLDQNYSSSALEIQVVLRTQVVDASTTNNTNIFNLQSAFSAGFQGFVNPSDAVLTATATTGTPAAGSFYTTIVNRAQLPDMSQDLKARMGIERIMTQSCFQLQNEFGPNGEAVWAVPNDTFGQIRLVGAGWAVAQLGSFGQEVSSSTAGDFVEITFYGTGLNVLTYATSVARSASITVDGVSTGTFTEGTTSTSNILGGRNYSPNVIIAAATGLTLGIHTVRLTIVSALDLEGFEVVNTNSSNVVVNPGASYVQGKKLVSSAQSVFAYNSVATGTRGGRVLVYQNADGSIGKAWTAVNGSSALLTAADHTNEEVVRTYFPREFGAGTLTDFSRISSAQAAAFTLDDGTTTLTASGCQFQTTNGIEGVAFSAISNSFVFTFVGTGLDIQISTNALVATLTYAVDGSTAASIPFSGTGIVNTKIVSGLPYGSHTFKLTLVTATGGAFTINKFIVYQPKKPALPSGAVELADYNVMANFSTAALTDNTVNGALILAQGTLFKSVAREWLLTGANWSIASSPYPSGFDISTLTNNSQPASYTFFGTGAVLSVENSSGGTFAVTVNVDGSPFSTATALQNMTNSGGGLYTTTTATTQIPGRIAISGLTLGIHTVTIQRTSGTGNFFLDDIQIITPIHSVKSNIYQDLQNTLLSGSNGISDNRKITPVKDLLPAGKAWAQAYGITSGPTTSSASMVPVPDISVTIKTNGGPVFIEGQLTGRHSVSGNNIAIVFYVDGVQVGALEYATGYSSAQDTTISNAHMISLAPGVHKIDMYYATSAATWTNEGVSRRMSVREL